MCNCCQTLLALHHEKKTFTVIEVSFFEKYSEYK